MLICEIILMNKHMLYAQIKFFKFDLDLLNFMFMQLKVEQFIFTIESHNYYSV